MQSTLYVYPLQCMWGCPEVCQLHQKYAFVVIHAVYVWNIRVIKLHIGVGTRGARGAGAPLKFWYYCCTILCYNVLLHGWCPPIETDLPTLLLQRIYVLCLSYRIPQVAGSHLTSSCCLRHQFTMIMMRSSTKPCPFLANSLRKLCQVTPLLHSTIM